MNKTALVQNLLKLSKEIASANFVKPDGSSIHSILKGYWGSGAKLLYLGKWSRQAYSKLKFLMGQDRDLKKELLSKIDREEKEADLSIPGINNHYKNLKSVVIEAYNNQDGFNSKNY